MGTSSYQWMIKFRSSENVTERIRSTEEFPSLESVFQELLLELFHPNEGNLFIRAHGFNGEKPEGKLCVKIWKEGTRVLKLDECLDLKAARRLRSKRTYYEHHLGLTKQVYRRLKMMRRRYIRTYCSLTEPGNEHLLRNAPLDFKRILESTTEPIWPPLNSTHTPINITDAAEATEETAEDLMNWTNRQTENTNRTILRDDTWTISQDYIQRYNSLREDGLKLISHETLVELVNKQTNNMCVSFSQSRLLSDIIKINNTITQQNEILDRQRLRIDSFEQRTDTDWFRLSSFRLSTRILDTSGIWHGMNLNDVNLINGEVTIFPRELKQMIQFMEALQSRHVSLQDNEISIYYLRKLIDCTLSETEINFFKNWQISLTEMRQYEDTNINWEISQEYIILKNIVNANLNNLTNEGRLHSDLNSSENINDIINKLTRSIDLCTYNMACYLFRDLDLTGMQTQETEDRWNLHFIASLGQMQRGENQNPLTETWRGLIILEQHVDTLCRQYGPERPELYQMKRYLDDLKPKIQGYLLIHRPSDII